MAMGPGKQEDEVRDRFKVVSHVPWSVEDFGRRSARRLVTDGGLLCHAVAGAILVPTYDACAGSPWLPIGTRVDPAAPQSSLS